MSSRPHTTIQISHLGAEIQMLCKKGTKISKVASELELGGTKSEIIEDDDETGADQGQFSGLR